MAAEGTSFGEKYELIERIATGGMAEIYRARYRAAAGITKGVVIKKILPHYSGNPAFVQMFRDEARIVVGLSHGNIAQVFDFGEVDGDYYLAMEHVHGQPLSRLIRRLREQGIPSVPAPFACFIALEMCKGLHYAHTRMDEGGRPLGIVHRDVSPQNVLLGYDGQVKLVDFGIAKARTAGRKETEVGSLKGKYVYFAPEQARGKALDARTDVFSAGIVLYEMLCGRLPFEGRMMDVLTRIVRGDFARPRSVNPELPPALERIILTAMALDPEQRFQSAQAMQEALAGVLYAHAPTFSNASLAHLTSWLFTEELGADGRTVAVPGEFLEQVPSWKRVPLVAGASPTPPRPSSSSRPASRRSADAGAIDRREVPAKLLRGLRADRRWWLALVPVVAALVAAGVVLMVGARDTFSLQLTSVPAGAQVFLDGRPAEGRTPLLVSRLPSDRALQVELTAPGMRRATRTVKPVKGGTVPLHVVMKAGPDVPFEANWPVARIPLQARHHGFAAAPTSAARVRLDPERSYRVWLEGQQAPVFYVVERDDAPGSRQVFGELSEGTGEPLRVTASTAFYAFTIAGENEREGPSARVRLQPAEGGEITTLLLDHRLHAVRPSVEQRFTLKGLDPQSRYEVRLHPGTSRQVLLFTGRIARVLSTSAPLNVTGEEALSFSLPDDGLDDDVGELLIAVTRSDL